MGVEDLLPFFFNGKIAYLIISYLGPQNVKVQILFKRFQWLTCGKIINKIENVQFSLLETTVVTKARCIGLEI